MIWLQQNDIKRRMLRKIISEGLGTLLLLATVVGSGIMGERLAGGNVGIALFANSIATGAMLVVLILVFGNISGGHFNPAVTLILGLQNRMPRAQIFFYIFSQFFGAIAGVWLAHAMFGESILMVSSHPREGYSQLLGEFVATFGLLLTILACIRYRPGAVAAAVGLYILAAFWFTSSTSFANPAVTLARGLTNTFSGIRPVDIPFFILAQIAGAASALFLSRFLLSDFSRLCGEEK